LSKQTRKLWTKPEDANPEMEELLPQASIGDTGAATLPLALVIGCARFEFNYPPAEKSLFARLARGSRAGRFY
jgi:3-oxoacyl-[acyl-carrier-protein] synthase-1